MSTVLEELAIIGGGLFGSSCAKYASIECGAVVLIGPSEVAKDQDIFGAWFDEGRIADLVDSTYVWRTLAKRSLEKFRKIERDSGITFYNDVGFLNLFSKSGSHSEEIEEYKKIAEVLETEGLHINWVNNDNAKELFPNLELPEDVVGFHQPDNSGHFNPRKLIAAQKLLAEKNGGRCIDGHVVQVDRDDEGVYKIRVKLTHPSRESETVVLANKILLSTGAYINLNSILNNLLPPSLSDLEPDLRLMRQTVVFLEVHHQDLKHLQDMPDIVTHYKFKTIDGAYILPPIRYPDGKYYVKIGHLDNYETRISDGKNALNEVTNWYRDCSGYPEAIETLSDFIRTSFLPTIKFESVKSSTCVTAQTPDMSNPYIEQITPTLTLVCGGNGYGANCSDEVGRIGAILATRNEWTSEIPQTTMAIHWRPRIRTD